MRFVSRATILGLWMLGAGMAIPALAADPPASMPRFEVSGIMLQEDGKAWALIAEPQWTGGAVRLVTPGAMIGPYRLVEVQRDHVILQTSSEAPLRVPFSWRGGGGGTAVATQPPPDRAAATRTQTPTPPIPTPAAQPAGTTRSAPITRGVASATETAQEVEKAGSSAAGAPAAESTAGSGNATPVATPPTAQGATVSPRPPAPKGVDVERMEALRRARERMFREEMSTKSVPPEVPVPSR